jgi:hypothetical protein
MNYFVNISNHGMDKWSDEQKAAIADLFGGEDYQAIDVGFPQVDPEGDESYIYGLALTYMDMVSPYFEFGNYPIFHVMGEMGFTHTFVTACSYPCIHSTTKRDVVEKDGVKTSVFKFCKFRKY